MCPLFEKLKSFQFVVLERRQPVCVLRIENIGFSSDPVNNKFGPGKRDLYLIHYVISGKGYYNGNPVAAGQGFLIKPHTYEYYYPDTDNPWTFLWVTSLDTVMEDIFRTLAADENTKIFNYNYVADVRNLTYIIKLTGIEPNVV